MNTDVCKLEIDDQKTENNSIDTPLFAKEYAIDMLSMVAHFICVLFVAFTVYTASPGSSLFSWHPTLMVIAFAGLMFEALVVFNPHSSLVQKASRSTKVSAHWIGVVTCVSCALAGAFVIWYNKEINGKPHMTTWHGTLGYGTIVYACVQCCAGILVKNSHLVKKCIRPADLKLCHATSGLFLFSLACGTLVLGMLSSWFVSVVSGTSWYACIACPAIMLIVVMRQVSDNYLKSSKA